MPFALPNNATRQSLFSEAESQVGTGQDLDSSKLKVAMNYGFLTWRQLEQYLELPKQIEPNFEHLACLTYWYTDHPNRQRQAEELLRENPEIEQKSIHSAAAAGNVRIVEEFLSDDPELLNHRGGYFDWEPLLYACYSRVNVPNHSTSDVVNLLLDRGADPNVYYRWGGVYLFSALTGICGEGEQGPVHQSVHPDYPSLAQRLLLKGADCNDSQALYNRMFERDNSCLNLLLEYGLNSNHYCNWFETRNKRLVQHSLKTLDYQMQWAVKRNHVERVKILLDHGAKATQKLPEGRLSKIARKRGYNEIATALEANGAKPYRLKKVEKFLNVCLSNLPSEARAMLQDDPELIAKAQKKEPDALNQAAADNLTEGVSLMLQLGFDVHGSGDETPLHQAAHNGHLSLVKNLIAAGASLNLRDPYYCSTPLGWAQAGNKYEVVEYLASYALGVFDLVNLGDKERLSRQIEEDPDLLERPLKDEVQPSVKQHELSWQTPLAYAAVRGNTEIVQFLLGLGANPNVVSHSGNRLIDLCNAEVTELLTNMDR